MFSLLEIEIARPDFNTDFYKLAAFYSNYFPLVISPFFATIFFLLSLPLFISCFNRWFLRPIFIFLNIVCIVVLGFLRFKLYDGDFSFTPLFICSIIVFVLVTKYSNGSINSSQYIPVNSFELVESNSLNSSAELEKMALTKSIDASPLTKVRRVLVFVIIFCCLLNFIGLNYLQDPRSTFVRIGNVTTKLCPNSKFPQTDEPFKSFFRQYILRHEKALANPRDYNWVIFRAPCEGLGNRIQGLLSSFLLAISTNRTWVVDWSPCHHAGGELQKLWEKPGFEWDYYSTLAKTIGDKEIWDKSNYVDAGYCRPCPIRHTSPEYYQLICGDINQVYSNQFIILKSTAWFGPALAHNPRYRHTLCEVFGGADMFGPLARALLSPVAAVLEMINRVKEDKFVGRKSVISLQLRMADSYGMSPDQEEVFWRCADALSVSSGDDSTWFLATDNIKAKQRLKELIGDRLAYVNAPLEKDSVSGNQMALADMWLLGEADEIIISSYSTFGYVGHGRVSKAPWVVTRDNKCFKTVSSQPCDMYWMSLSTLSCFTPDMYTSEMVNQDNCYL